MDIANLREVGGSYDFYPAEEAPVKRFSKEFFEALDELQSILPKNYQLNSCWDVEQIIRFLTENQFQMGISSDTIEEWKQKLSTLSQLRKF
jgi:hypothetical protein